MAYAPWHLIATIMKKNLNNLRGTVFVLSSAILWGTIGIFVRRLSAAGLSTWDIALVRMTIGLAALATYLLPFGRNHFHIYWKDTWIFAGAGILSLLCMNYCYNETVKATSLAVAGTLLYTAPTFVMLMSLIFFKEQLTLRKIIALILAFVGCSLVSGFASGHVTITLKTFFIGLGAGFSYALYSIFSRAALNRNYNSWTITFYSFVFCILGCLVFSRPTEIIQIVATTPTLLIPMILLGFLTGFLAYLLYTTGLTFLEPSRASIIASLELVAGAVVGFIAFHEIIGIDIIIGIIILLSAVVILSLTKK